MKTRTLIRNLAVCAPFAFALAPCTLWDLRDTPVDGEHMRPRPMDLRQLGPGDYHRGGGDALR